MQGERGETGQEGEQGTTGPVGPRGSKGLPGQEPTEGNYYVSIMNLKNTIYEGKYFLQ